MVNITGPTLAVPKSVASMGTPMKPVLGHAATNAPKEASLHPISPPLGDNNANENGDECACQINAEYDWIQNFGY